MLKSDEKGHALTRMFLFMPPNQNKGYDIWIFAFLGNHELLIF